MKHSKFPGLRWDVEGNVHHCETEDDVQEGWTDNHPDSAPKAKAAGDSMTRPEIVAALEQGGITFSKNAPTAALAKQLHTAVFTALEEAAIAYEHDMTTKQLLGLLTPPE